jgi:methyl-accepting chemotaxis protein
VGVGKWFRDRPIRTKLLIGFVAVTGAITLISLEILRQTGQILADVRDVQQARALSLADLAESGRAVFRAHDLAVEHALAQSPTRMREIEAEIPTLDARVGAAVGAFEKTAPSAEERAVLARFKVAQSEYRGGRDEAVRASADGRKAEALAAMSGRVGQQLRAADEAMSQLIAARSGVARAGIEASQAAHAATWRLTVALVLGGLAFSVVLALVIARTVSYPVEQMVKVLETMERGDLTGRFKWDTRDEMGWVAWVIQKLGTTMRDTLKEVDGMATHVAEASRQLSGATAQFSSSAQEQAASLEETAASLEELTASVKQNAGNAQQASGLAVGTRDVAERGGQVVTTAMAAMEEITRASKRISDIIATIDEIAFQTNLLALNAAVEAARAGEAGRGFAVVAVEVRNLAQGAATAAREIRELIQDSVGKVESGSALVNRSGQALHEILASVKQLAGVIGEISATSQEQAGGIEQVNRAVSQMDQAVQRDAASAHELLATAQALAGEATHLRALVGRFKLEQGGGTAGPKPPAPSAAGTAPPAAATGGPGVDSRPLEASVQRGSRD